MLDHAQILRVENIGSPLILINRHILAWSGFLHDGIFPAAWMRAGALIGISSGKEVAQQTPSGIGNTHSAMHKALDLHILRNPGTDLSDLF